MMTQAATLGNVMTCQVDPAHTHVEFAVRHLMIATVRGRCSDVNSGSPFARVAAGSRDDARVAVDAASKAFSGWSATPPAERARLFLNAAEVVKRRRREIAEVLARETGCTISFATFQQDLVAATLQQVAGWVYLPKGEVLETNLPGTHSIGVRRPLGVVGCFTPWNGANILSWRGPAAWMISAT